MLGRLHKWLGALLLLPLLGWCITGAIFLTKPGYGDAYAALQPKFYPLEATALAPVKEQWLEVRLARSVLGSHLFARNDSGWRQYDPQSLALRPEPAEADIVRLLQDATSVNKARYGQEVRANSHGYVTDTGVLLRLDWNTMTLEQHGTDRAIIDQLYNVHYLRWTGYRTLDNVLGILGLSCLVLTSVLGARLLLRRPQ